MSATAIIAFFTPIGDAVNVTRGCRRETALLRSRSLGTGSPRVRDFRRRLSR
jgi:hypothetical protein